MSWQTRQTDSGSILASGPQRSNLDGLWVRRVEFYVTYVFFVLFLFLFYISLLWFVIRFLPPAKLGIMLIHLFRVMFISIWFLKWNYYYYTYLNKLIRPSLLPTIWVIENWGWKPIWLALSTIRVTNWVVKGGKRERAIPSRYLGCQFGNFCGMFLGNNAN